jgi:hypothetical protein
LDEQNPTNAGLTQENGFGPAEFYTLPWLVKKAQQRCAPTEKSVINMI